MASVDTSQLYMTANSLRTFFGDNMGANGRQSMVANHSDMGSSQMSQRPPERRLIDYDSNPHFSRLDRNLLNQMPHNCGKTDPPLIPENRFYDPNKMPQKSILKKSKDQLYVENTTFRTIEDEDLFIYGSSSASDVQSGGLPAGIVSMEPMTPMAVERSLSPISLRLKQEMENMGKSQRSSDPIPDTRWTPRVGVNSCNA
ncbi:unnamed protein product [Oppiella nova]|uniref:Uncharacterized protein n=1 Tax=Oppiella nova TaxID=334625 RepID=A0A7R9R0I1_9ACAR|nr:unnamed protein product [Oppiella nova]CAG2181467.1 unnamed protein product [Oppiella nova]